MKKVLFYFISICLSSSLSFAQDSTNQNSASKPKKSKTPQSIEAHAKKRSEHLSKHLQLNEDQKPKVYAALLEKMTKIEEIKAKYPTDKKAAHAEIKVVRHKFRATLKEILNELQLTQWEDLKKKESKDVKKDASAEHE